MGPSDGVRRRCMVTAAPNDRGAVTLYGADGRTYQVIDAADEVRDRVRRLRCGDRVTVVLEPVRCRGDGWRLVRVDGPVRSNRPSETRAATAENRSATRPEP